MGLSQDAILILLWKWKQKFWSIISYWSFDLNLKCLQCIAKMDGMWWYVITCESLFFFQQILDKLLDRESQTHKPQTLSSFYSSKPATGSQKSPSKHATHGSSATGGVSKHTAQTATGGSNSVQSVSGGGTAGQQGGLTGTGVQGTSSGDAASENREQGDQHVDQHNT